MTIRLIYSSSLGRWQIVPLAISMALAFAAIVALALRLLPAPHTRIHYLIAGTIPTGLGVLSAIAWIEYRRFKPRRTAPKSERLS